MRATNLFGNSYSRVRMETDDEQGKAIGCGEQGKAPMRQARQGAHRLSAVRRGRPHLPQDMKIVFTGFAGMDTSEKSNPESSV
jgi:hypothetical protein